MKYGMGAAENHPGRVLVCGAGGFLGSHALDFLLERGHDARAADLPRMHHPPGLKHDCPWLAIDLLDPPSLDRALEGVSAVVNATGLFNMYSRPSDLLRINETGSANLARAAAHAGAQRFVHLSSVGVYGRPATRPCRESDPKRPGNVYERSKWAGEKAVRAVARETGLPTVVLRPTLVYGPRSRQGLSMMMGIISMHSAGGRRSFPRTMGPHWGHHLHARDLARAIELSLRRPEAVGGIYNVADRQPATNLDLAAMVLETLEVPRGFTVPAPGAYLANALLAILPPDVLLRPLNKLIGDHWSRFVRRRGLVNALGPRLDREWSLYLMHDHVFSTERLARLGMVWEFPTLAAGLADTLRWYRQANWLP